MASVVLVTGASSGIGLATAVAFARDGDRVFATVRDGRGREALQQAGAPIEAVTMDVRDDASVRSAVDGTVAAAGRIDVLVNNAGISHIGAVETTPDDVWRQLFEVNVLGPVRVLRAVLPSMRAAGSGTIVNVSSMNGRVPATFGGAYSATKFALEGLSESLLFEVEPFRVRVVIVEPGQFDTPIFSKMQSALAASADPTSPYAEREAKMLGASLPAGNGPADPADAAAVIVAAARGDRPGFRHVAGADAEAILAARVGAGSDEAWFDLVRAFLSQRADPDSADDGDARKVDARSVHHSQSFGGMWFTRGVFDPIRGSIVAKELERLTIAMFEADWAVAKQRLGREPTILELKRTPAQRRADALVEMATRSAVAPADGRRPEPLFTVLVGWETLSGRICELAHGTVIAPGALVAWLDRAWLERVVFASPSRVIDVGETRRLFAGATRRAVQVRDRECFHPTCEEDAEHRQVDHVIPWNAGGPTIEANGRLACGTHNRQRHARPPP